MDVNVFSTVPNSLPISERVGYFPDTTDTEEDEDYSEYSNRDDKEFESNDSSSPVLDSSSDSVMDTDKHSSRIDMAENGTVPSSFTSVNHSSLYNHNYSNYSNYSHSIQSNRVIRPKSSKDGAVIDIQRKPETAIKKSPIAKNRMDLQHVKRSNDVSLQSSSYHRDSLSSSIPSADYRHYSQMLEGHKDINSIPSPLPSPISKTIEELDNAERRFTLSNLSKSEKEEYRFLLEEYKNNEETIQRLRKSVNEYYGYYVDLRNQQMNEITQLKEAEEEYLNQYKVKELENMKIDYTSKFEKQTNVFVSQIEDNFEKRAADMYKNTQEIVKNMNRSFLGKILFAIVWILEFVGNWLKREWSHMASSFQKNGSEEEEEEPIESVKKRKPGKSRKEEKKKGKKTKNRSQRK